MSLNRLVIRWIAVAKEAVNDSIMLTRSDLKGYLVSVPREAEFTLLILMVGYAKHMKPLKWRE